MIGIVHAVLLLLVQLSAFGPELPLKHGAPLADIPFELRGDLVILHAQINGTPTRLILDSGSGLMALDTALVRQAGVTLSGPPARALGVRTSLTRLGIARQVRLDQVQLDDVRVIAVDLAAVQARVGRDVQGTLGYELFARFVVEIDYDARRVLLFEPADFNYEGSGTALPINIDQRTPVVNASLVTRRLGTIPARLIVDLGSTTWALRLGHRFVNEHRIDRDTVTVTGLFGVGVGGLTEGELLRIPELHLGGLVTKRPSTALSTLNEGAFASQNTWSDGTVGVPILRRTRVILDYSRRRIILEPRGRLDLPDAADASGLTLVRPDEPANGLRVAYVVNGSAAARAGVRIDDIILSIDDHDASRLSVDDARSLLLAAGATRRVSVRRGVETFTVRFTLSPII